MNKTKDSIFLLKNGGFLLILTMILAACSSSFEVKDGATAYNLKRYHQAAQMLQDDYNKASTDLEKKVIASQIAESFRKSSNFKAATEWYRTSLDHQRDSETLFEYGRALMYNEDYDEALGVFTEFLDMEPYQRPRATAQIQMCKNAKKWTEEPNNCEVEPLTELNSSAADFAPRSIEGKGIVFSSSRSAAMGESKDFWTGQKMTDLFFAELKPNGNYRAARSFSDTLNSFAAEGSAAFSKNGKQVFFTRCQPPNAGTGYCQIYFSEREYESWSEPVLLKLFEDSCNVGDPFLSADGNTLYVSSDAANGFGNKDIYSFQKTADGWGQPSNLGIRINTEGNERYPFIDDQGVMYFASDGHPGLGGLDIFSAKQVKGTWTGMKNMKSPINSGADDFALIVTKSKPDAENDPILANGIFTSARSGGKGSDDLYSYRFLNKNFFRLKGTVVEKKFEDPDDPDSRILGMQPLPESSVQLIFGGTVSDSSKTATKGKFDFELIADSDYEVLAKKEGYFSKSITLSTKNKGSLDSLIVYIEVEIELEKIWPEKEIVIPNIYYDYNEASLRPESLPVLDSLLNFFSDNSDIVIEIGSHTDSRGTKKYNEDLSQRRAESVVNYLVEKGLSNENIRPKGYGEVNPVNECVDGVKCSEEKHQENRRTSFKVLTEEGVIESVRPDDIRIDPKQE